MIQGTTPTLRFNLPFGTSSIEKAEIVVEYVDANKKTQIVKESADCKFGSDYIEAKLTQEETLSIPAPATVCVQLRVLTKDGTALATVVKCVSVKRLLKGAVIK